MKLPRRGLYAITQTDGKTPDTVLNEVAAALRGGAAVVQYRDKNPVDAFRLASALQRLCATAGVPLLINDDAELARQVGAAGVHLGRDDGNVEQARRLLGDAAIIGVSCYNDVARAQRLVEAGADYAAFGRFFPSGSKPLAAPAQVETLRLARQLLTVPIVAIGGILPENGKPLLEAGAGLLAVIGGIFDHEPEAAARAYRALFEN